MTRRGEKPGMRLVRGFDEANVVVRHNLVVADPTFKSLATNRGRDLLTGRSHRRHDGGLPLTPGRFEYLWQPVSRVYRAGSSPRIV